MVIPLITLTMITIPPLNKYFIIYPGEIILNPLRDIVRLYQGWFYVHTYYSYLLVAAGTILLIYRIIRPGTSNRIQCLLINATALTFIGVNAYNVFLDTDKILFVFPLLTILCVNVFFWTLYFDETEKTIYSSQGEFVETLQYPIIVTNRKNYVIFVNCEARNILTTTLGSVVTTSHCMDSFPDFVPYQFESEITRGSDLFTTNIILTHKKNGYSYYLHSHTIYSQDKKREKLGSLYMLITISAFNNFFLELENKAFKNHQCGCYNRHYLDFKIREFNTPDVLPLTCMICDMDNLKP